MTTTTPNNPNERLLRFLQATPEQQAAVDRILEGRLAPEPPAPPTGPLLLGMGAGAKLLGVSRATFWRMIKAGRLTKVEVLPGSFRVRRADVERVAEGRAERGEGGGQKGAVIGNRSSVVSGQGSEVGA